MFQHIDADDAVETAVGVGQVFANAHIVADFVALLCGMYARGVDRLRSRIDARYLGPFLRERLGHETASTAQIENRFAGPVDIFFEPVETPGHHVLESSDPLYIVRPPLGG